MSDEILVPDLSGAPANPATAPDLAHFTGYQKFVVAVLAFLQFTVILDFMILSPLGVFLMPAMNITPAQFGLVVSVYAFSAGGAGLLAAGFADRFDRKKLLLFFYAGFTLGTLFCALAPNYEALLAARMITGLFGGVIGSIVFAITTDLFPMHMRGRVMGFVQTSFAASQILGLPIGLYISNIWGWHAPFLMIVGVAILAGLVIFRYLQPIDGHLKLKNDRNAFSHLWRTLTTPRYVQGFLTTALLSTGGFMLMPFSSAFSVHNVGVSLDQIPLIYMVTGACAIVAGPLLGRAADKYGKFNVFLLGTVMSASAVYFFTHLGITPLYLVMVVNAVLFIGISARIIGSSALMSGMPTPESRGSFMAVSSSIQQISGGLASVVGGLIVYQAADGRIERFDMLGYVVIASMIIVLAMMYGIHVYLRDRVRGAAR